MKKVIWRRIGLALTDVGCWLIAGTIVYLFGTNEAVPQNQVSYLYLFVLLACLFSGCVGIFIITTYRSGYRTGSFEEIIALACQFFTSGLFASLMLYVIIGNRSLRFESALLISLLALFGSLLVRAIVRTQRGKQFSVLGKTGFEDLQREPVLVIGAGVAGNEIVRMARADKNCPYRIVGLLDDDPAKSHLKLSGVPVVGKTTELAKIASRYDARTVILSPRSFPRERFAEISMIASREKLRLVSLPPLSSIVGGKIRLEDIRDVDVADFLGRREVRTDLSAMADYINGKIVLVSGAGGSIGAEIARQVYNIGPRKLLLLDRDESALHSVQLDIYNSGLLDTRDVILCDIRDKDALEAVFDEHRPEVVIHAAALKHLPMLENYPEEGWKTNVMGTLNMLECSLKYEVQVFVNISTDKAADPTSILGKTKRVAERLTAYASSKGSGKFVSVRFGNVLGSRGSVLWTFDHQINHGGPVTITHPDVERYFMTIPEACQLVLQAGAIGESGQALILDMGKPARIVEIAQRMIERSGRDIEIRYTGLRAGEKLSEVLISSREEDNRPKHPLISHAEISPLSPSNLSRVEDIMMNGAFEDTEKIGS